MFMLQLMGDFVALPGVFEDKHTDVKTERKSSFVGVNTTKGCCSISPSLSPALPPLAEMKHEKNQYILVERYSKAS